MALFVSLIAFGAVVNFGCSSLTNLKRLFDSWSSRVESTRENAKNDLKLYMENHNVENAFDIDRSDETHEEYSGISAIMSKLNTLHAKSESVLWHSSIHTLNVAFASFLLLLHAMCEDLMCQSNLFLIITSLVGSAVVFELVRMGEIHFLKKSIIYKGDSNEIIPIFFKESKFNSYIFLLLYLIIALIILFGINLIPQNKIKYVGLILVSILFCIPFAKSIFNLLIHRKITQLIRSMD